MRKVLYGAASFALLVLLGCNQAPNAPKQANVGNDGSAIATVASTSAMAGSVPIVPSSLPYGVSTNNNKSIYEWDKWVTASAPTSAIAVSGKNSAVWYVSSSGNPYRWVSGTGWMQQGIPGYQAIDIGAGSDVYAIATNNVIYKYNSSTGQWAVIQGLAKRIDCDESGHVWCVDVAGLVWELTPGGWMSHGGITALDIGVGGGVAYAIDVNYIAYKWTGSSWAPMAMPATGSGTRIAVDQNGSPWIAGTNVSEFFPGRGWISRGNAKDIAAINPSNVYAVGTDNGVYQRSGWQLSGSGAGDVKRISGKTGSTMWCLSSVGMPWQFNPSAGNWIAHALPNHELANDIGVGSAVYVASTAYHIWKWNGSAWILITGSAAQIDCDESGHVWSVSSGYTISELTSSGWVDRTHISNGIPAWDIGVGNGAVWAACTNNQVYKWNPTYLRWDLSAGGAGQRIAVDPFGYPWTVYNSVIYTLVGSSWQPQNRVTNIPMQDVAAMTRGN